MRTSASHRREHRSTVDDPHLTAEVLCALVPERRRTGRQTAMGSMFFDTPIVTNHPRVVRLPIGLAAWYHALVRVRRL